MSFQTQVNLTPAIGVAGDLANTNPYASFPAPEGGFVAGSSGVTVGRFAWIASDGKTVNNTGSGAPDAFVHRETNALITAFLAESSNVILQGMPVALMRKGDFLATATVAGATKGQKAFAKLTDGTMQAAAAGATVSGFIETPFTITRTCLVNELAVISN